MACEPQTMTVKDLKHLIENVPDHFVFVVHSDEGLEFKLSRGTSTDHHRETVTVYQD